jgi:hypothetical protein
LSTSQQPQFRPEDGGSIFLRNLFICLQSGFIRRYKPEAQHRQVEIICFAGDRTVQDVISNTTSVAEISSEGIEGCGFKRGNRHIIALYRHNLKGKEGRWRKYVPWKQVKSHGVTSQKTIIDEGSFDSTTTGILYVSSY